MFTFESRLQVVLDLLGEHGSHEGGATTEEQQVEEPGGMTTIDFYVNSIVGK